MILFTRGSFYKVRFQEDKGWLIRIIICFSAQTESNAVFFLFIVTIVRFSENSEIVLFSRIFAISLLIFVG